MANAKLILIAAGVAVAGVGAYLFLREKRCELRNWIKGPCEDASHRIEFGNYDPPGCKLGTRLVEDQTCAVSDGLVFHAPLDEGAGDVAHDVSTFGNDGTIVGCEWAELGDGTFALKSLTAYDYVSFPTISAYETEEVTYSAWCWVEFGGTIVGDWDRHCLYVDYPSDEKNYLALVYKTAPQQLNIVEADNPLTDRVWTHLAVTFDNNTNKAELYINGTLKKQEVDLPAMAPDAIDFKVGNQYKGLIKDARMYNRVLNAGEIAILASVVPVEPTL